MAKALGADIKEFFYNNWPAGYYVEDMDDSLQDSGGLLSFPDDEKIDLSRMGYLLDETGQDTSNPKAFAWYFNRWMKSRASATVVLTVAKSELSSEAVYLAAPRMLALLKRIDAGDWPGHYSPEIQDELSCILKSTRKEKE